MSTLTLHETDQLTPAMIVRELRHLPSSPKLLPRLKELLQDGNSSMRDIVALIRLDPGIAARVLQVGHAISIAKGKVCHSVEDAVNFVGYDQIYELVAYAVASQVLVRPLAVYAIESEAMWRESVACALAAEILAEHCNEDSQVAYSLGLLHAVGMVAIDEWALRNGPTLMFRWKDLFSEYTESERRLIGCTQAEVGGELLRSWNFPAAMWDPMRAQYRPASSAGFVRMSTVLHVAKWLRTVVNLPPKSVLPSTPELFLLSKINLTPGRLIKMVDTLRDRITEATAILTQSPAPTSPSRLATVESLAPFSVAA